jgi:hypothetical protein
MGSLNRPPDVLLRALASVKAAHMMEGASIFEIPIGDSGQVSSTMPCKPALRLIGQPTLRGGTMTTWWARRHAPGAGGERGQGVPWAGCVGASGDEFPGAESLQGAEGFPRRSVIQSWHATNFGFSLQAPSYTLDFDRPSRFLKLRIGSDISHH